ncbi:hypothetical protein MC885_013776 [Smutsia gigantea]|nr:hypothetical protein MC885_013776 [Smutsia gigantea]
MTLQPPRQEVPPQPTRPKPMAAGSPRSCRTEGAARPQRSPVRPLAPPRPGYPARGPGVGGPRLAAVQAPQLPLSPAPG